MHRSSLACYDDESVCEDYSTSVGSCERDPELSLEYAAPEAPLPSCFV